VCIPLSLLGNYLVKMFKQQRKIVGDIVFCAVHVISKESMGLKLPINGHHTSFFILSSTGRQVSV
jgi:hypothetical protein